MDYDVEFETMRSELARRAARWKTDTRWRRRAAEAARRRAAASSSEREVSVLFPRAMTEDQIEDALRAMKPVVDGYVGRSKDAPSEAPDASDGVGFVVATLGYEP